ARKPPQTLCARSDIFILVFVRARHKKSIKPAADELGPQSRNPRRSLRRISLILEGLIKTVEHEPKLGRVHAPSQPRPFRARCCCPSNAPIFPPAPPAAAVRLVRPKP